MQEDFLYKTYLTESMGAIVSGDNRKHWFENVQFLYEKRRKEAEIEVDTEEFKKDFVRRFNKGVNNERI